MASLARCIVMIASVGAIGCARAGILNTGNDAASTEPASAITEWFDHIQRDELDSLSHLLAPDFVFVSDGARYDADAFVAMIRRLGIHRPRVTLSNIVSHRSGDTAYLIYDRLETFTSHGQPKTVPETGTMVLTRARAGWRILLWTTTSPP
jgi:ketosteroid isomerase-like protein